MRFLLFGLVLFPPLMAQGPYDVKLETPQVRVIQVDVGARGQSAIRTHEMNRVLIWIIEIELRSGSAGAKALPKLDPVAVDARHYSMEFENDQVRVLRVHFGPHEKGVMHEHVLDRVVVYLTDQASVKAGTVRMAGAATHTEENAGDASAELIAVELK